MNARKLTDDEIQKRAAKLEGWAVVAGKLHRSYECKDFSEAFGDMTRVALAAESMNHHPEWCNVWNKVTFDLSTHSIHGISDLDFMLAEKIHAIFTAAAARSAGK